MTGPPSDNGTDVRRQESAEPALTIAAAGLVRASSLGAGCGAGLAAAACRWWTPDPMGPESGAPEKPLFGSDSEPLFVPPPVPTAAPKVAAPKVAAPKVAAPKAAVPKGNTPVVDTDGWDDLFGDD